MYLSTCTSASSPSISVSFSVSTRILDLFCIYVCMFMSTSINVLIAIKTYYISTFPFFFSDRIYNFFTKFINILKIFIPNVLHFLLLLWMELCFRVLLCFKFCLVCKDNTDICMPIIFLLKKTYPTTLVKAWQDRLCSKGSHHGGCKHYNRVLCWMRLDSTLNTVWASLLKIGQHDQLSPGVWQIRHMSWSDREDRGCWLRQHQSLAKIGNTKRNMEVGLLESSGSCEEFVLGKNTSYLVTCCFISK